MFDRIYCKNFRRIGECDIALKDGITVLIGKNGTGKSSIIESIAFNLYGKVKQGTNKDSVCRKTAAPDDLTFTITMFTIQGRHFRCTRGYNKKKSPFAELREYDDKEYQMLLGEEATTKKAKELGKQVANGVNAVTEEISELLGISYDGFKASFLAQQKELDSFATLTPDMRKKFFLDLLGYSKLDNMKPNINSDIKTVSKTLSALENQNMSVAEAERNVASLQKDIAVLEKRIADGDPITAQAKDARDKAAQEYEDSRVIGEKCREYKNDVATFAMDRQDLLARIADLKQKIIDKTKESEGYDPKSKVRDELAELQERAKQAAKFDKIHSRRQQAEGALSKVEKALNECRKEYQAYADKTKKKPDLDPLQEETTRLTAAQSALQQQLNDAQASLRGVQELINSVDAGDTAKCPTCGTSISTKTGRAHLDKEEENARKKIASVEKQLAENAEALDKATTKLKEAKADLRSYEDNVNWRDRHARDVAMREMERDKVLEEIEGYKQEEAELAEYKLTKAQTFDLNEKIHELGIVRDNEDKMRDAYFEAEKAKQALEMTESQLKEKEADIRVKKDFLNKNKNADTASAKKLDAKCKADAKYEQCRALMDECKTKKANLEGQLKSAEGNLNMAKDQAHTLVEHKERLETLNSAAQVVEYLRKNLPSRIAPHLADTASHILDIATNGRYTMLDIDDTYNIQIYTDDDIRPLNMMSGGEADVISLAIRIAISKMLLEATGITSQTFILDEIFGALDDERKESTCAALQNIETVMSKILCITHIDEIKDMADYTYVVDMDANGVSWVTEQKPDCENVA